MFNIISKKIHYIVFINPFIFLLPLWFTIQGLLLFHFGIVTSLEAVKYSEEAQNYLQLHQFSEPKYIFYSAYIFLHILFYTLGFETVGVYIFQLLANLAATYAFYKLCFSITNKKTVSFTAVLLLLLCYSWQFWTVYLYTESFFCSLLIIFSWLLFQKGKKNKLHFILLASCFLLILIARPTGMFIIPVLYVLLFYYLKKHKKITALIFSSIFIIIIFFSILNVAIKGGTSYDFMKPLLENNVLCYIPAEIQLQNTNFTPSQNPIMDVWYFIIQHPGNFLHLALLKFLSYWGMIRPYYSPAHNAWLMCFFYPVYFFAIFGFIQLYKLNKYFFLYTAGLTCIFTMSVLLTCDDWNNRFNMPIIPIIILASAVGINSFITKYFIKNYSPV